MRKEHIDLSYFIYREWVTTNRSPWHIMEDYELSIGSYGIESFVKFIRFWCRVVEEEGKR